MRYDPVRGQDGGRPVLARLRAGEPLLSLGVRYARTPDIARMASGAGYDLLWIDLEHSTMPIDTAAAIAATATDLGLGAWVRVPEREHGVIGRLLDGGATGIIAPRVETVAEAARVAAACRFPPRGERSQLALLPQSGFVRMPAAELTRTSNDAVAVQILLESRRGIDQAEAIAALDGVDMLAIGMNDLTAEMGVPGETGHPDVRAACATVAAAAARHGKLAVIGGVGGERFRELLGEGFAPLVFAGIDTDVIAAGLAGRVAEGRAHFPLPADGTTA